MTDETTNHIISECSKLAQKEYKTRVDWVGKVIHRELCKDFKFHHANKRYMHNPAPAMKNEIHKLAKDFNIQMDPIISARQPDHILNNKKERTCKILDVVVQADHIVKLKESEKRDKYLDLARELKKTVEHECDVYTNCNWCSWNSHRRINKGPGRLGNLRTRGHHQNKYIIENDPNTEKSSGDLKEPTVTQTSEKDHQLTLI